MRAVVALGAVLGLLATAAGAQSPDGSVGRGFRVTWSAPTDATAPVVTGRVVNDLPYRVSDVRLRVEGFNAERRPVGQTFAWALGDIDAGGETSFAVEAMPDAVSYRIDVVSFDAVTR